MNWVSSWFPDETVNIASAYRLKFGNHMREIGDAMVYRLMMSSYGQ
jgi:hypothetical protein